MQSNKSLIYFLFGDVSFYKLLTSPLLVVKSICALRWNILWYRHSVWRYCRLV